ncbi:LCP family protein [Kutzneria kofuensis]|uniref:LCP family protein required for cell wall assembly n=1 Tax=Kutzneria kofuensis TaxID=103725 RepID=A0A7W9KEJ0_9PSEU|nr:LCP family protein [Kutzneria kofuensis]MBB5891152.1 LCP family protein required for cell wall assembly [Kutzneria kofuensis]
MDNRYRYSGSYRRPPRPANGLRKAKIAVATASALTLLLTWFGWTQLQQINSGLTTADVIESGTSTESPADGSEDILLVGMDSRTDAQGNSLSPELLAQLHAGGDDGESNTDTMILVHIPNGGSRATAISIPRDSYVDIAGGHGTHKINSAFAWGKNAVMGSLRQQGMSGAQLEVQSNQEGAKTAIRTVQDLTGVTVDHYAQINLAGFYDITQAIGGVQVCLKAAVDDDFSGAHFQAGEQSVSGAAALAFVRQRHGLPKGDLDRIHRQQAFMAGMARKVLSAGTLTDTGKLAALADAVKKSVVLDQGWDLVGFAQQLRGLTGGSTQFTTIPVENMSYETPHDGDAVKVDPFKVRDFVRGLTATTTTQAPPAITVDVLNGAGVPGLAGRAMDQLVTKGYGRGDTGNTAARSTTLVTYGTGGEADARKVAADLGGGIDVSQEPSLAGGHVEVYLGSDYRGPGAQGWAAGGSLMLNGAAVRAAPTTSSDAPITADGVTCVN